MKDEAEPGVQDDTKGSSADNWVNNAVITDRELCRNIMQKCHVKKNKT